MQAYSFEAASLTGPTVFASPPSKVTGNEAGSDTYSESKHYEWLTALMRYPDSILLFCRFKESAQSTEELFADFTLNLLL